MRIKLNGKEQELAAAASLQNIVAFFSQDNRRVIAEVNGEIIKNSLWADTLLKDGDAVELVSLVGGG